MSKLCLCANNLHIHLHLRSSVPAEGYSKHCVVVSKVTNLPTIHVCIWYVISFSESQCTICSKQMQHILLLTPLLLFSCSISHKKFDSKLNSCIVYQPYHFHFFLVIFYCTVKSCSRKWLCICGLTGLLVTIVGKVSNLQRFISLEEINISRLLRNSIFILTRNSCISLLRM